MAHSLQLSAKELITRIGKHVTPRHVQFLNSIVNYLEVGRWIRSNGFDDFPRYSTRRELHAAIAAPIANTQVLYLEFGVYQGESFRHWCKLLQNPGSSLQGFDSFQGLPEKWDTLRGSGTFTTEGRMPQFDDNRVVLHPGWFKDTLLRFVPPEHDNLVVHLDADLFSSTELVLRELQSSIVQGTIIIFDEFCDRFHELRAFDEYLERTRQRFHLLGATRNLEQVVFQRIL
jgi:O-methyltransferase